MEHPCLLLRCILIYVKSFLHHSLLVAHLEGCLRVEVASGINYAQLNMAIELIFPSGKLIAYSSWNKCQKIRSRQNYGFSQNIIYACGKETGKLACKLANGDVIFKNVPYFFLSSRERIF